MTRLIREGAVREAIVVGVWNTQKRFEEYVPAKAMTESKLPDDWADMVWLRKATIVSDDYLRFLVEELKPFVDSTYRTLPGRADMFTMGSSAGALMRTAGYTEGRDWLTRKYEGDEHSERAWRRRVDAPLKFLLGPPSDQKR